MARAAANWERLVRAALRGDRLAGAFGVPVTGIAGNVPSSLGNNVHIEEVLRAADEIQDEDPTVARILCEHAYTLAQSLDPNSEGRGVLQFKTGLMSVIRQKLAKREVGAIDRSQDVAKLQEFYKLYREKHKVDELCEDEMKLRESAVFSGNLGELERKTLKRKKVLATLKVIWSVIEEITMEISPDGADKLISEEEHNYVGRGMHERPYDYIKYVAFWLAILGAKFSFTYFLQIEPLVKPTRQIISFKRLEYDWHDFVSKNNHNALTILSLWAPVVSIYLLDIHVFYTVMSAISGFLLGARDRLGERLSTQSTRSAACTS